MTDQRRATLAEDDQASAGILEQHRELGVAATPAQAGLADQEADREVEQQAGEAGVVRYPSAATPVTRTQAAPRWRKVEVHSRLARPAPAPLARS